MEGMVVDGGGDLFGDDIVRLMCCVRTKKGLQDEHKRQSGQSMGTKTRDKIVLRVADIGLLSFFCWWRFNQHSTTFFPEVDTRSGILLVRGADSRWGTNRRWGTSRHWRTFRIVLGWWR